MPRTVRIVGSDDLWEVIGETRSCMTLINRNARLQEEIDHLEAQLAGIREQLGRRRQPLADCQNNPIYGP
jgi:hypothetical protein